MGRSASANTSPRPTKVSPSHYEALGAISGRPERESAREKQRKTRHELACGAGCLHACQLGRRALVHDMMEPYRPLVDREVLAFVRPAFTLRDSVIDAKGVCRLHPELARQPVASVQPSIVVRPWFEPVRGDVGVECDASVCR